MQLTVLGSAASFPGAGQACSGYLVESEGTTVMIDCGNGTVAMASEVTDVTSLDAVLVSHTHADHFLDLYALQAALRFAPEGPVGSLPIHLPEGLWERMKDLLPATGRAHLAEAFEPHVHVEGQPLVFGEMTITAHAVDHDGPSFGFVVECEGSRLAYTGDTRDGEAVRALAKGCDVLVAECTLPTEYAGVAAHLSPAEAGRLAKESGAGLLVLTHLWPTADHERMRAEAAAVFGGDVVLAGELMTIEIGPAPGAGRRGNR
jgi:ribonuclease BN (tRNA processing enzyme)